MNEEIIAKTEVPELPVDIRVQYANREFNTSERSQIKDLSESGVRDLIEKVRNGTYQSLYLTLNEDGEIEEGYFQLESGGGSGLIFLQICDEENQTAWACFDPERLESEEEAPIEPSDGQSVIPIRNTMKDRDLAAKCVEWYIHTCEPYPGMDWMKLTW